jgi:hypothetical protein
LVAATDAYAAIAAARPVGHYDFGRWAGGVCRGSESRKGEHHGQKGYLNSFENALHQLLLFLAIARYDRRPRPFN